MTIVLDILPKLLNLCTSTTAYIDADVEGGGVVMNDFRVMLLKKNSYCIDSNYSTYY